MDYVLTKQLPSLTYSRFAQAIFKLPCRSDLDNADKNATIFFDNKYDKCWQDISKRVISVPIE